MSIRIENNVTRPRPIEIYINGAPIPAYEGESLATALMAAEMLIMSRGPNGTPHSPFCNMGVCFDCMVLVSTSPTDTPVRARACMTPVKAGLHVSLPPSC